MKRFPDSSTPAPAAGVISSRLHLAVLAAVGALLLCPVSLRAADPAGNAAPSGAGDKSVHSPSTLAWELQQKKQLALITAALEGAKGTPNENLYRALDIFVRWPEYKKSRAQQTEMGAKYVAALNAYLDTQPQNIDPRWALDNAKFLFAAPSEQVITRLEYWANSAADRHKLEPMAKLAARLLKLADDRISAQLAAMDTDAARRAYSSDEAFNAAYMKLDAVKTEITYNQAWAYYFSHEFGAEQLRPPG